MIRRILPTPLVAATSVALALPALAAKKPVKAMLLAGVLTLIGTVVATAGPPPSGENRAGGIPACEAELAGCQAALAAAEAELATTQAALAAAEAELATTQAALAAAEADLMDCETALANAQIFPGDGAGLGPELSYTDNGDGTVTDNNTGLMWEVKLAGSGSCLGNLHAAQATCTWNDATGAWIDALNAEGGTGYAGYSDWRLPNLKELQSIVDSGRFNPSIDPVFGTTATQYYWSATSFAGAPSYAWFVSFDSGFVRDFSKTNPFRVRAVRGGP